MTGALGVKAPADASVWTAAAAVIHWWGVSDGVIYRWRKLLDVTRTVSPLDAHRRYRASHPAAACYTLAVPVPRVTP
jgi:hypothetical protein